MLGDKTVQDETATPHRDPIGGAPGAHSVGVGAFERDR